MLVTRKLQWQFRFKMDLSFNIVSTTASCKWTSSKKCVVVFEGEVCCSKLCPLIFRCVSRLLTNTFSPTLLHLTVAPVGTGRFLSCHWSWSEKEEPSLLIGQKVAAQADQEAVFTAEVERAHAYCMWLLAYTYSMNVHHHRRGEELLWVRGLQTTAASPMTWKHQRSMQHGQDSALTACSQWGVPNYCGLVWVLISIRDLPGWRTEVGTWFRWSRVSSMASPRRYGHSTRDITNVMQKLQGRCKMLTHSKPSTSVLQRF